MSQAGESTPCPPAGQVSVAEEGVAPLLGMTADGLLCSHLESGGSLVDLQARQDAGSSAGKLWEEHRLNTSGCSRECVHLSFSTCSLACLSRHPSGDNAESIDLRISLQQDTKKEICEHCKCSSASCWQGVNFTRLRGGVGDGPLQGEAAVGRTGWRSSSPQS